MLPLAIASLQNEEERAFMAKLYSDHKKLMYAKAFSIVRDHAQAEDVVGEACIALIDKISLIRAMSGYTLRAYVVSTIRNTAINFVVRRDRQSRYAFLDDGDALGGVRSSGPEVLDTLVRREQIDAMKRAILRLPEHERTAITMKYLDQMSDREIADTLGIGPDSVRSCLMRARRHVKEQMKG